MKYLSYALNLVLVVVVIALMGANREALENGELNLPVVAFSPSGDFGSEERDLLWDRVVTPFTDYNRCLEQEPVSVAIEKKDTPTVIAETTYRYTATMMLANPDGSQNAIVESMLIGETDGELEYWVPALILTECVDTLPNADEVRDQAVDEYRG